jgi:signal transduction histidine kinase
MADAVLFVSPDGQFRLRNRAADGMPGGDLRTCHPLEKWDLLVAKIAAPELVELHPIFQVNGRSYEANYARVSDADGKLHGVVMVARDVTERIETQKWRMQEERLSVVGKLAAGLAHELNNPLAAIALFAQHALAEVNPADRLSEYLGTVLRNANLCKKIVRDLLEYARQRPPERGQIAMSELLGDVVRTLQPHAQASGIAVRCEMETKPDFLFYGDADQLRQVLVNLGLNGIEAMPHRGALTFRLTVLPGGSVQIEVSDTGVGIPPQDQERIFNAFHTTKPEGTGLGLTVARDLVTAHGGTLRLKSTPGLGSTFIVTLPGEERDAVAGVAS